MPAPATENIHQHRFREDRMARVTQRLRPPRASLRQASERNVELVAFQDRLGSDAIFNRSVHDHYTNQRRLAFFYILTAVGFSYDAMFTFSNIASYLGSDLARLLGTSPAVAARLSALLYSFTLLATTIALKSITESYGERQRLDTVHYEDVESLHLMRAIRLKVAARLVWVMVLAGLVVVGWKFEVRRGELLEASSGKTGISSRELAYLMAYLVTSTIHTILLWFPVRLERGDLNVTPCSPVSLRREIALSESRITEAASEIYHAVADAPQDIQPRLVSFLTKPERAAVNRAMGSSVFGESLDGGSPATQSAPPPPSSEALIPDPAVTLAPKHLDGVL